MAYYSTKDPILRLAADGIRAAQAKQLERLSAMFPKGSRVGVKLFDHQVSYSPATVSGHVSDIYGGCVCVVLDYAKANSRFRVRCIGADDVIRY